MPSLKTIRKRIVSVKSTQKITRAMKMVAGARLNRAQQRIVAMRPYAEKTAEMLETVSAEMAQKHEDEGVGTDGDKPLHALLVRRPEKRVLYLVLSSDRGLCGAFNTNIIKASEREWRAKVDAGIEVSFSTIGRKAREVLARRRGTMVEDFQKVHEGLSLDTVGRISQWIVARYADKVGTEPEFDAVYIVYNEFQSAITQRTIVKRLLPIPEPVKKAETPAQAQTAQLIYEPSQEKLLEKLVPMYLDITIYRALLDSQASEYGARMTAMDAATRNAKDMIGKLTLIYNRARQASITKELMEIIGGAEALKD